MGAQFRSVAVTAQTLTTGFVASAPAGVQQGDLLVTHLVMVDYQTTNTPTVTCSGWTVLETFAPAWDTRKRVAVTLYKFAGASEPASYTFTDTPAYQWYWAGAIAAFSNVDQAQGIVAHSSTFGASPVTAPTLSSSVSGTLAATLVGDWASGVLSMSGATKRWNGSNGLLSAGFTGKNGGTVTSTDTTGLITATSLLIAPGDSPPNAPSLTGPANNSIIDRSITQRFSWLFSDPDAGDSQSKFDLQWWPCDASFARTGAATTVTGTTPNQFNDFAAGYWAAGNFEWQVRTYDAQGMVGPWSASSFFTAATAPTPPTITAPTSGGTVANTETVTWSEPNQDSYQIRRVADNAGTADPNTVYYDSGEVDNTTARSADLTFETNNRWEHVEVRVKFSGLWSSWSDVRVHVSYTPPPAPQVTTTPAVVIAGRAPSALDIAIVNPAPGTGVPAASYNDVYVDDGDGKGSVRKASMLAPNSTWRYATPRSDVVTGIKVVAVAANGTSSEVVVQ